MLQNTNLSAREKRIRLKREFLAEPSLLQGDDALLQLMLRNLLDNAVRYSPENSEVGLYFHADRIEVRDQGTGIAPNTCRGLKNVSTVLPDKMPKAADWVCPSPNTSPNSTA